MAPPQRYESPSRQLLELGRKARAEGLTFEEFWQRAVRPGEPALTPRRLGKGRYAGLEEVAIVWPSDTAERADAQDAAERSKPTWQRAYNLEPATAGDLAIAKLRSIAIDEGDRADGIEDRSAVPLPA